ncbi:MAG: hypothetical protein A3I44_02430 [Candidatus Sungbacteria bacterium RIFCSPLOWO2_02_FULL_51_17]|uniref:Uncharacterized protein n=1 Tax=Candidatus Sungbacteria bacterium RIFCSPHIGHO2_02_FULL_51_29 TaxID=1802273 RepID=A0A1G2KV39_9BACT|nr:MAG: hypothetical protein A2676_00370 [Candidatus Sungbacteria bacterium RIFCSPHIGHO2_01_FULL_51_22]OHA03307.1 MAG: hypothetical protein A3C16_01365 [Candidatus Sungbacteria bacterium RIFCSPHIGHO2_02_FULL_51_29]OHA11928.1 MAG: hypothetical protein A3I44_02430 [Candidatus Sungbacteria bacterium RIFCSPLOWO2_02_FULL_51_17]
MGIEKAPEKKAEASPSFEEFKRVFGEYAELRWQAHAAGLVTRKMIANYGYADQRTEYAGSPEIWKDIPAMADLVAEEVDLMASGVSESEMKKYSTLYKRAYERAKDLQRRGYQLAESNPWVFRAEYIAERQGKDIRFFKQVFGEDDLRGFYEGAMKWWKDDTLLREARELESSREFREVVLLADIAKSMMAHKARWEHDQEDLKREGFTTPEEKFADALKKLEKIKGAVGEKKYKELAKYLTVGSFRNVHHADLFGADENDE